ncbi:MmpS family transport accessory protein [Streptomyces odonnellii]|uniref:MmpS family transport accessory protein n=1 Tax=Streptomyces odonnellii TaxID=1417980 RepID=UPI0006251A8B|nr:MmpS family transport accessory protein [Streptomyces odonnellii]
MNSTIRTVRAAVGALAAAGLALGLTACSETVDQVDKAVDETYEVTYEVTGDGVDTIEYHGGGGKAMEPKIETVEQPTLPWQKTVTLRGIMPPAVMPIAVDITGAEVTCKIVYQGEVIKQETGAGLAAAGGCVAVSPIAD